MEGNIKVIRRLSTFAHVCLQLCQWAQEHGCHAVNIVGDTHVCRAVLPHPGIAQ